MTDTKQWVCQTCDDTYTRKVVGLNGIGSCYCGGTLTRYNRSIGTDSADETEGRDDERY